VSGALGLGLLATLTLVLALLVFPGRGQSGVSPAPGGIARVTSAYSVSESSVSDGSQTLWSRDLQVPNSYRAMYVTVTGQSDVHNSAVESLGCQIDGADCSPSRWLEVQNVGANDWHDNSVTARWCVKLTPGPGAISTRHVTVSQSSNGGWVYIEKLLITVDVDSNTNDCQAFPSVGGDASPKNPQHG
jgi:hypothetical protein